MTSTKDMELALQRFSIEPSWDAVLKDEYAKPYFVELAAFLKEERASGKKIFPQKGSVFHAFQKTPFEKVKVVIMGQDPYHGEGQAHGLSFSVPKGIKLPPSLQNIFKELFADLAVQLPPHGNLEKWTDEGVLLLNAILTVSEGAPLSHHKRGWEQFTDAAIRALAMREDPVIFLLWGRNAIDKCKNVRELEMRKLHTILTAPHPSPFSAYNGFFGCKHFSKVNEILVKLNKAPIDWKIE
jgi:uracil-DNA glycosylase